MKRPGACEEVIEEHVANPASGSKPKKTLASKAKAAPAAEPPVAKASAAKVKASAKTAPKAKSATNPKGKQRPPPMEPGQATVYYMQGKVHRNSGCFRVFKHASDKKDLKIKIAPDAPISDLWNRALDIIEAAAAEPWDAD